MRVILGRVPHVQVGDTETRLECLLNNNKNSDFCAPLTSFDWNEVDPNLLGGLSQCDGHVRRLCCFGKAWILEAGSESYE